MYIIDQKRKISSEKTLMDISSSLYQSNKLKTTTIERELGDPEYDASSTWLNSTSTEAIEQTSVGKSLTAHVLLDDYR